MNDKKTEQQLNAQNLVLESYDSRLDGDKDYSQEEAMKIIEESSGKQFDPKLVQLFKSVLPEIEAEIKEFEENQKTAGI